MRDWTNIPDRRAATLDFREFMVDPLNDTILQSCCDDPSEAKRQFASKGKINIPPNVEFRVYRTTDQARHNLAVLILPSSKGGMTDDPANILIAAWPAWGTTRQQVTALENQLALLRTELAAEEAASGGPQ